MVKVEPTSGYSDREWLILLVPSGVGILGAFIALKLWRFGLSSIGGLGGAALAITILSMGANGLINTDIGRFIFVNGIHDF